MAALASKFDMSAIKLERRVAIMIEFFRFPRIGGMAAIAFRYLFCFWCADLAKLPAMSILMAILAGHFQSRELIFSAIFCHRLMATFAFDSLMAAIKCEFCLGMVKFNGFPTVDPMTIFAASRLHIFINLPLMRIFMASQATDRFKFELNACFAAIPHNHSMACIA